MPMAHFVREQMGARGNVFADSPGAAGPAGPDSHAAQDGVSCATCHQILGDNLGQEESYTGGFEVDVATGPGERRIFGPFDVAKATRRVMSSASGFEPRGEINPVAEYLTAILDDVANIDPDADLHLVRLVPLAVFQRQGLLERAR